MIYLSVILTLYFVIDLYFRIQTVNFNKIIREREDYWKAEVATLRHNAHNFINDIGIWRKMNSELMAEIESLKKNNPKTEVQGLE